MIEPYKRFLEQSEYVLRTSRLLEAASGREARRNTGTTRGRTQGMN